MSAPDAFSEYYADLLQGTYDCVDRIVLNAFFPVGQIGGRIRTWWRWLRGDDLSFDDEHLREMHCPTKTASAATFNINTPGFN